MRSDYYEVTWAHNFNVAVACRESALSCRWMQPAFFGNRAMHLALVADLACRLSDHGADCYAVHAGIRRQGPPAHSSHIWAPFDVGKPYMTDTGWVTGKHWGIARRRRKIARYSLGQKYSYVTFHSDEVTHLWESQDRNPLLTDEIFGLLPTLTRVWPTHFPPRFWKPLAFWPAIVPRSSNTAFRLIYDTTNTQFFRFSGSFWGKFRTVCVACISSR